MCGIVGYISKNIEESVIKKMNDRIIHRGPDGEGYFLDDTCALGHRRLAIIDLKTGTQPIYNEDGSLVIIFNGEIYNYQDLRQELLNLGHLFKTNTDTEVIVHGFEAWGENLPNKLRGMFAFAIWDRKNQKLFLARDNWGIKPLYFYQNDDVFMFASEIKAFLDHPLFIKEFNEKILASYLCFNSTPTKETFFKNVYRLEPGHTLTYENKKASEKRYFALDFEEENASLDETVNNIYKAMEESVKYHKISDVEVGSFLSSGIDSSFLVSLARPDKTFTVGYDDPKYDEISYAKDLADKLHIENKSKKITKEEYINNFAKIMYHMDEPLADPSAIALYFVSMLASQDVKVVTSGEGADELFGGYNIYKSEIDSSLYLKIPYFIRHILAKVASIFPDARGFNFLYRNGQKLEDYSIGLSRIFRDKEALKLVNNKEQIKPISVVKPFYEEYKNKSNLVKRQVIDFYFWLVRDFLHAVDRNTMAFGLEARTPFLDKAVYEVARKMPSSAKVNKTQTKVALRLAAKKVIPNEAYNKKKLGFPVPLRAWLKEDDLYNLVKEKFESSVAQKYFDQKKVLKLLQEHKNNKKDNYKKVWTIYTFLVWYEIFFGKEIKND